MKSKSVGASVKPNLSMFEAKHTSLSASYQTDASVEEEKTPPIPCVCVWAKSHVRVSKQSCKQGNRLILRGV